MKPYPVFPILEHTKSIDYTVSPVSLCISLSLHITLTLLSLPGEVSVAVSNPAGPMTPRGLLFVECNNPPKESRKPG